MFRLSAVLTLGVWLACCTSSKGQVWVSAGTVANEVAPTEVCLGFRNDVGGNLQLGLWGGLGSGKAGFSVGFDGEVADGLTAEAADVLGHDLLRVVAKRRVLVLGGGVSVGLNTELQDKVTHTLLIGYEAGDNDAVYQIRDAGVAEYGVDQGPYRYDGLRLQYMGFVRNLIFGLGYVYGSSSGLAFHFGYSL